MNMTKSFGVLGLACALGCVSVVACGDDTTGGDPSPDGTGATAGGGSEPADTEGGSGAGDDSGVAGRAGSSGGSDAAGGAGSGSGASTGQAGDGQAPDGMMGAAGAAGAAAIDADAPEVLETAPVNEAKGVEASAVLVFRFSEPMDAESTEAAYASTELPAESVNFQWNDAGDTLTIIPKTKLAYSEGDASVNANGYSVRIGMTATDREGESLAQDAKLTFSTLRRVTELPPLVTELTGTARTSGAVLSSVYVGDTAMDVGQRGLLTFSLEDVPAAFHELELAEIYAPELAAIGAPDTALGQLSAHHVFFTELVNELYAAKSSGFVNVVRLLALNGMPAARRVDVKAFVLDDLENREARKDLTQVRLQYPKLTADATTSNLRFDLSATKLTLRYLAE